ncbi:hypothetical protein AGMMS49574_04860 [Bacteroidia bacterium]|nr:hypothetical protein AGMMS49574_04860 [Bacteroidia bacterium]
MNRTIAMKLLALFWAFLFPVYAFSQFNETFSGAGITSNNPWTGDLNLFRINDYGQFQFSSPEKKAGSASLSVSIPHEKTMTWEMDVKLDFKTSNSNNLRIYVHASEQDTFYIQVGNNDQEISFYEKKSKAESLISGRTLLKDQFISIRLTLEDDRKWTLYTRKREESHFQNEGEYNLSQPLGDGQEALLFFNFRYVKARISNFYIDNIKVTNGISEIPDPLPPTTPEQPVDLELQDIKQMDAKELQFIFNQPVDISKATCTIDDTIDVKDIGYGNEKSIVNTRLPLSLEEGKEYIFTWKALYDLEGNAFPTKNWGVEYENDKEDIPPSQSKPGQVLINEVMANPKGLTAFPETEYVELYNLSDASVSLKGWTFIYDGKETMIPSDYILPPKGYAVLYKAGRDINVDKPSQAIGLEKFPAALANTGKTLALKDASGSQIDRFDYPAAKAGISWERLAESCYLSTDIRGGTPGSANSNPDNIVNPPEPGLPTPEPDAVASGDIVFNEILPNPFTGGSEYIELFNRSNRAIPLTGLAIASRKEDGTLNGYYSLSSITAPIIAGGFALLTKNKEGVASFYLLKNPEAVYELKLPTLTNTTATLVLFNQKEGSIVDEIAYSSKWHNPSVKDQKGVALERISPKGKTQDATNWTSATALAGYGTPGYENSQFDSDDNPNASDISAPAQREDGLYYIIYHLDGSGYSCRAYIFDMSGKQVAQIANHELLGTSGEITWDGRAATGNKLRSGVYIFFIELYNTNGKTIQSKKVFLVR